MFLYEVDPTGRGSPRYYLSPMPKKTALQCGLPSEAILGELVDGPDHFDADHFRQNVAFLEFLHSVIARHGNDWPLLQSAAKQQPNGSFVIHDLRSAESTESPPDEDLIGTLELKDGKAVSYRPSTDYRLFTSNGLLKLHEWLHDRLLEDLIPEAGSGHPDFRDTTLSS